MLPFKYQKPVIRSLSAQKKLSLWQEKLQIVLQQNWDEITKNKIVILINKLNLELYDYSGTEQQTEEWQNFVADWENDMLSNNRIDSVEFIVHFCTLMTFEELDLRLNHADSIDLTWLEGYQDITDTFIGGGGSASSPSDCECRYDIYCSILGGADCASGGCSVTSDGCGIVGMSKCKGLCPENSNYSNFLTGSQY
ncbi:MAG: bacteriocin fulvocin C-related protein [Lentimicrobium sp.]|nr:bacteriocin fulvocin C-related protein [Lentimicrobium sp.]